MNKSQRKRLVIIISLILLLLLIIYTIIMDRALTLTEITIESDNLPAEFNGFKIAHLSDFHNVKLDKDNKTIQDLLKDAEPDIIAITGDMIDSRKTDIDTSIELIEDIINIAPCYYVTGNHESRASDDFETLEKKLIACGVYVLRNSAETIEREGSVVEILGIDDPDFVKNKATSTNFDIISAEIIDVNSQNENYKILLSHRPEAFDVYCEHNIDLVLAGHAHGGQIRIPFAGGLIAPGQGIFPKYDSGKYFDNNTSMIVSRGIGNSIFPIRINNRPEIVIVELTPSV